MLDASPSPPPAGTVAPVSGRPVLLVSDLDGTMVGDDKATAAFRQFWLDKALVRPPWLGLASLCFIWFGLACGLTAAACRG